MMGTEPTNQALYLAQIFAEDATATADTTDPAEAEVITFEPKQQEKVNQLIKDAQGRAAKELRQKLAAMEAEVTRLKGSTADPNANPDKGDPDPGKQDSEFKRIAEQRARELDAAKKEVESARKDAEKARKAAINTEKRFVLTSAAAKQDFVDVNDAIALTDGAVVWDEDSSKFIVVNENGEPRLNAAFAPMSVDEFYADYATKKPHLVKSGARGGAGSTTSNRSALATGKGVPLEKVFGRDSDAGLANRIAKENPAEYKRLRTQAVEAGLLRK